MSPDGSTKPPPEEKLLNLIRGKSPRAAVGSAPARFGAGRSASVTVAVSEISSQGWELRWPKMAAGALVMLLAIEGVAFLIQATRPIPVINTSVLTSPPPDEGSSEPRPLSPMPSLAASASRPLFTPPVEVAPSADATKPPKSSGPSVSAKLLASRLTLMGVIPGNPGQAIIEDSQTKKTYFVTPGQALVEGAVLEQVLDNRVILDLDGEKIELTL